MLFMVLARIVYAFPFLIYSILHKEIFITDQTMFTMGVLWLALFLVSLFFFSLGKFTTWPMTHFVFIGECILYSRMFGATDNVAWLLFVWLSSFFAIEALRNDTLHIFVHLLLLGVFVSYAGREYDVGIWSFFGDYTVALIFLSALVCRSFMSIMDSKNVLIQKIIKRDAVYAPVIDEEERSRLIHQHEAETSFLKESNERLKQDIERLNQENEMLTKSVEEEKWERAMSLDVANRYFRMSAAPIINTKFSMDDNMEFLLRLAVQTLEANYAAIFECEGEEANLTHSVLFQGEKFYDDWFVDKFSEDVFKAIKGGQFVIEEKIPAEFGMEWIGFIPCKQDDDIQGVLAFGFKDKQNIKNMHFANLMLMVACRAYVLLINRNIFANGTNYSGSARKEN